MRTFLRSLLVALLTASALVGVAPAPARAAGSPPVVLARAGIGSSHFGGGGRGISRPRGGFQRRGYGRGFFFGGVFGFPLLPILLLIVIAVILRNRRPQ